jgi:hypothetical protein
VDSVGDTIDFMLSPKRDLMAVRLFLRLALSGTGSTWPRVINVDGHPAYACAIAELKQCGDRVLSVSLRGIAAEFNFSREGCSCPYFLHGVREPIALVRSTLVVRLDELRIKI